MQSPVCPSRNPYDGGCGDARMSGRRGGGGGGGALRMSVCLRGKGGGTFLWGPLLALVLVLVLLPLLLNW